MSTLQHTISPEAQVYAPIDLAMQQAVGQIATTYEVERADEIFADMSAQLAAEYQQAPERYNNALLQDYMANPKEALKDEMLFMADMYRSRSISVDQYDGSLSTEFITRNVSTDSIDALYRISESRTGTLGMTVEARLQGRLPLPCRIRYREHAEQLEVRQAVYRRGWRQEVACSDEQRDMLLRGFFASTIWAARLKMSRSPEEQVVSDAQAKELLFQDRIRRRGSLAIEYY